MEPPTLNLGGQRYVILEEAEYQRLRVLAGDDCGPPFPRPNDEGNYSLEALDVIMARDIVRERKGLGLSQAELARRAGIRAETLNRIEQGKHVASIPTFDKIRRALRKAEQEATQKMDHDLRQKGPATNGKLRKPSRKGSS